MVRRILAAALVATLALAAPALATMKPASVKFRMSARPTTLMVAGQPWQGTLDVIAPEGADVADFEFEGDGWQIEPMRTGAQRAALAAAGGRATLPLVVRRANPAAPLTVKYVIHGETIEQSINLRGLARKHDRVRPLRPATPADEATAPFYAQPERFAAPGLANDRRSVDAEGLQRGALGDTRLEDDAPAPSREAAPNGAQATQAKQIRVHGRLMATGPLGNFGADGVYFAVYDEDSGVDELLAEGTTDVNGFYDVTFTWDPCLLCDDNPDIYVYFETENAHVITQSPVLEWEYSWETGTTADYTGTDLNKGTFMPGDNESNGVLYAHTCVTREWRFLNSLGWNVPSVDVQCWDDDANPVSYYTSIGEIHLAPGRMFNTSSMCHEYGHHWMEEYSNNPAPSYCNGMCDSPSCGHCRWCKENGDVVWSEGFPNYNEQVMFDHLTKQYLNFTNDLRDEEVIQGCNNGPVDDGFKTEGIFAAALWDLVDSANEDDPLVPGPSIDNLSWSKSLMYTIMDVDEPTTVSQFFTRLDQRMPGNRKAIWSTAMNGGLNLDSAVPSAVTNLASTDHTPSTFSGDATISLQWTEAADDWSGAGGYSILLTNVPSLPDTTIEAGAVTTWKSPYLSPGTYFACVRTRDRAGRWGTGYAVAGPYWITQPDPADLVAAQPAGWFKPLVPRMTGDATSGNVAKPTSLTGFGATYWNAAGYNGGQAQVSNVSIEVYTDGHFEDAGTLALAPPETNWTVNNQTFVTVSGGRHTLGMFIDGLELVPETNETNNTWARQWAWSPMSLNVSQLYDRNAAPYRLGGVEDLGAGELQYSNADGYRVQSSGWWNAYWAYAKDFADDYDVRLHFPSSSVDTSFAGGIASSVRTGGLLDAVIVNRNTMTNLPWDVGVTNYNDGASMYRVKHVVSTPFTFGDSVDVNFPQDEFITLHDMYVNSGNYGDVVVTLRTTPGAKATVQWRDRTFTYGGLTSVPKSATTDSTGMARFVVNVASTGYYGVACYRDPKDGTDALPFTLQVERAPADLATFVPAGWYSPVVPRPATDGTFASVPMPDTLHSTPSPTYFNMAAKNVGTLAAPPSSSWMLVDGVLAASYGYPTWNAGAQMLFNSTYAVYIRGGRHTLSHILDGPDAVEELVTSNNQYGEQYVWSPLPLAADTPLTRTAPPDRTAGWSEVSDGAPVYFNVDGFRTASAMPAFGANMWSAVAVMPSAASDVDLRLFETSPGTKNGFRNPVATSVWATGQSDFVMANFNSTGYRLFDVGAVRYDGTDNYTVQAVTSTRHTIVGGVVGTFTQGANDLLDLREVWLTPGTWGISVETLSGAANLGLSVHGAGAFQGKSNALGTSWLGAAGQTETVVLNVVNAGYYCLAVWKTNSSDLAQTATYRLVAANGTLDAGDVAPTAVAFGTPAPNPMHGSTSVWYALPSSGRVSVDVFDVSGARVRSLVRGERAAGRYSLTWDGRTDDGARAPAGLYYLRFEGGGLTQSRKVVRVE